MAAVDSFVAFEGKQATEIFKLPFVTDPSLAAQGIRVINDVQSRLYLYYTSKLRKITTKRVGCGNSPTGTGVTVDRELIQVTDMHIYLDQCSDTFNQTILEGALKKGVEITDLTNTEIDRLIADAVLEGGQSDYFIQMWFSDVSLVGDAFYGNYEGFFKHIQAAVTATTIVNQAIGAMAVAADAYNTLLAVFNAQVIEMKAAPVATKQILVTRNIYDLYIQHLSTLNGSEIAYTTLVNGIATPTFMGVKVIVMDHWDSTFAADFAGDFGNGRVVMNVSDETLIIALDTVGEETLIDSWYSKDDQVQKYNVKYKVGTILKFEEMFSVAGFSVGA